MALFAYVKQTQRLLRDARQAVNNPSDLISFVNTARGQVAGEGECIRVLGTVSTAIGQRNYAFSAISTGTPATNGIQGVINVRSILFASGSGNLWVTPRNWEWFLYFGLNNAAPVNGLPQSWAQFGQGSAGTGTGSGSSGSFYLDPPPSAIMVLTCDCACYPIALVDDTTVEALPYLWTDAVPFYAAYYGFLSLQRKEEAAEMFQFYKEFMQRSRQIANPSVSRALYAQAADPALMLRAARQTAE